MLLELAERLRCPEPHAASPMIIIAEQVDGRVLERGVAGCPTCYREAQIVAGIVRFGAADGSRVPNSGARGLSGARTHETVPLEPSTDRLDRTIALLGLADPGGHLLLSGRYRSLANALAERLDVHVVLWEPEADEVNGTRVSGTSGAGRAVPFSDNTFRAAAVDEAMAAALPDVARTLMPNGRILAPIALAPISSTRELARDSEEWLAEASGALVPLIRRS